MGVVATAAGRRRWRRVLRRRRPYRCERTGPTFALLAEPGGAALCIGSRHPSPPPSISIIDVQCSPGTLGVGAVCMRGVS